MNHGLLCLQNYKKGSEDLAEKDKEADPNLVPHTRLAFEELGKFLVPVSLDSLLVCLGSLVGKVNQEVLRS